MTSTASGPSYILGSTDFEHERLIRQAAQIAPMTEQFFREAGIGRGQRVLDLGSGVGDVTMLAARLVGPSGKVVGIERDARSIARARSRASHAGLENVSFMQCDALQVEDGRPFDAVVGRFILQFLPDPTAVLRSLARLVRPGGLVAFQEVSWSHFLQRWAHLPLWSATSHLARETLRCSGANLEIGFDLYPMFQEAGLPAPVMKMEVPLGTIHSSSG
jgi:ubiquinone/menaquinone biosynthesis C-methylase UbiE